MCLVGHPLSTLFALRLTDRDGGRDRDMTAIERKVSVDRKRWRSDDEKEAVLMLIYSDRKYLFKRIRAPCLSTLLFALYFTQSPLSAALNPSCWFTPNESKDVSPAPRLSICLRTAQHCRAAVQGSGRSFFCVVVKTKREMLKLRPSSHLALWPRRSLMELHPFQMTESITAACTALQRKCCVHWIYSCYLLIMCAN